MGDIKGTQTIVPDCPNPEGQSDQETHLSHHQDEDSLSSLLLNTLGAQGYEFPEINSEHELTLNLRHQLEKLNSRQISDFSFTDIEWTNFHSRHFRPNLNLEDINKLMHLESSVELQKESGAKHQVLLLDKANLSNNQLQVIKHPSPERTGTWIVLINGIPTIQINLTKNEVSVESARQILNYQDSITLLKFTQIFILSNGSETKYFSNSIRSPKVEEKIQMAEGWGYANHHQPIKEIVDFATTFLKPTVLLEILSKYCILDSDEHLKILRPYQIAAIERILHTIHQSINSPEETQKTSGYIWHANGTGKTLTSFKVTQLAFDIPQVKKVIFVTDKKYLDNQTYSECQNFFDDSMDLKEMRKILNDDKRRIIVTNTQKLRRLLGDEEATTPETRNSRIVIISDECHRNHTDIFKALIEKHFPIRNWFGFTGTPLIKNNEGTLHNHTTTIFETILHRYTWIDAITCGTTLPILVRHNYDKYSSPTRKYIEVVEDILDTFEELSLQRQFNAMFAVGSTSEAVKYYKEFQRQQQWTDNPIKIAMIFNPPALKEYAKWNDKSEEALTEAAFKEAMDDYNEMFNVTTKDFGEFKDDVSQRLKNKEIDLLLVVNMFLEGLNAPTLNTIYIDKNLSEHTLIQTFSRINRIMNREKRVGNVVLLRDIKQQLDEALLLFSIDEKSIQSISLAEEN